jgi:hypothetical protein
MPMYESDMHGIQAESEKAQVAGSVGELAYAIEVVIFR